MNDTMSAGVTTAIVIAVLVVTVASYILWHRYGYQRTFKIASDQLLVRRQQAIESFAHLLEGEINVQTTRAMMRFNSLADNKDAAIDVVSMAVFDVIKWDDDRYRIAIRHQHDHRCTVTIAHEWPQKEYAESFAYMWRYEKCDQLVRRLMESGTVVASVYQ